MRIISGTAGRRKITVPKAVARPTTDRTREALFSMLAQHVHDARVLDLFAGSGALGLESLSRGARECSFVDADRGSIAAIRKNLQDLRLNGGKVIQSDVLKYLQRAAPSQKFDLIFADPPYCKSAKDTDWVQKLFDTAELVHALSQHGLLVIEAPANTTLTMADGFELIDKRVYGGCGIFIIGLAKGETP